MVPSAGPVWASVHGHGRGSGAYRSDDLPFLGQRGVRRERGGESVILTTCQRESQPLAYGRSRYGAARDLDPDPAGLREMPKILDKPVAHVEHRRGPEVTGAQALGVRRARAP